MRRRSASWSDARSLAVSFAPLLYVIAAGLLLRLYFLAAYNPVAGVYNDTIEYLTTSEEHLFRDPFRPAGYPLFLRILRYTYSELTFVVVVQHLLGLLTGVFLYLAVRHVTQRRWLPALPAALVVLSGDQLMLEHSILTEALYTFLATAGICGTVIGTTSVRGIPLLTASGAALGVATTVRTVAVPLVLLSAAWILLARSGRSSRRLIAAASLAAPALAIFVSYVVLQGALTGVWGVSKATGWALYTRVAPFADCNEFEPPEGTKFLCETKPSRSETAGAGRPGPGYYQFVGGPSIQRYGNPFETGLRGTSTLGEFAGAVLLNQPLAYAREVGRDMLRYIVPTAGYDRAYSGAGADELDIARRVPSIEELTVVRAEEVGFDADPIDVDDGVHALQDFQQMIRVDGLALVVLLVFAVAAVVIGRSTIRLVALFLGASAIVQAFVPVASISWGFRYGVVAIGPLAAAATLGIHAIAQRTAESRLAAEP